MAERKGLYIKHDFNNDFVDLFTRLKEKYGDKVLSIHGIGDKDLDMTTFPKRFYGKSSNVAMVSVDDNANVNEKTMTQYRHEKYKAMDKINSIYMMYKWVKKFYLLGLYTESNLDVFVRSGDITEEQKQEIIASKI